MDYCSPFRISFGETLLCDWLQPVVLDALPDFSQGVTLLTPLEGKTSFPRAEGGAEVGFGFTVESEHESPAELFAAAKAARASYLSRETATLELRVLNVQAAAGSSLSARTASISQWTGSALVSAVPRMIGNRLLITYSFRLGPEVPAEIPRTYGWIAGGGQAGWPANRTAIVDRALEGDFSLDVTLPAGVPPVLSLVGLTSQLVPNSAGNFTIGLALQVLSATQLRSFLFGAATIVTVPAITAGSVLTFVRAGGTVTIALDGVVHFTHSLPGTVRPYFTSENQNVVSGGIYRLPFTEQDLVSSAFLTSV